MLQAALTIIIRDIITGNCSRDPICRSFGGPHALMVKAGKEAVWRHYCLHTSFSSALHFSLRISHIFG